MVLRGKPVGEQDVADQRRAFFAEGVQVGAPFFFAVVLYAGFYSWGDFAPAVLESCSMPP